MDIAEVSPIAQGRSDSRPSGPRLLSQMRPYFRRVAGLLVIGSLAGIAMNVAVVLPAVLLGHAIDVVLAFHRGHTSGSAVTSAALLFVAGTAATELPRMGKRWWLSVARARIRADVRADAFTGVLAWPAERLHTTAIGDVMARIIGDVDVLGTGVGELIVETWDTLLFSVSLMVAMFVYAPTIALLALAPVPLALALAKVAGILVTRRTLRAREANAELTSFVQEGLAGLRVLHASGRRAAWARQLKLLADKQAEAELAATRLNATLAPIYATMTTAGVLAVIWLGGTRVAAGALSVGDLVAFLSLFTRFTGRAYRIPQMANRVQAAAAALTRLSPLLASPPPSRAEPSHASWRLHRVAGLSNRSSARRAGGRQRAASVVLQNVSFHYPGTQRRALNDVSLAVEPGSLVAVTGPVGSGKSALAAVVVGLFPVQGGRVRVDGVDPHSWTEVERNTVGYVPQGYPVFSGSIADNVLLADSECEPAGDMNSSGRLAEALRVAGLDTDVTDMADGPATRVGEFGVRVSGGQRQRIALARSLAGPATRPQLLVLDDPFSAVDTDTEMRIIAALREAVGPSASLERQATIVLCSTRLAAFPEADKVIVLDHGRVVERGKHQELLAANGLYARIYRAQRRSYAPTGVQR